MTTPFVVTSITVSAEVSDKSYGNGNSRSVYLKADTSNPKEGGLSTLNLTEIARTSLELAAQAHKNVQYTRYIEGEINGEELENILKLIDKRLSRVLNSLNQGEENDPSGD
jgi:hypothetical protein